MFVVIFRAKVGRQDDTYVETAARLRELALTRYGCLDFVSCQQNGQEIAVSYWPDQQSVAAWRKDPEHLSAQQRGTEHWYSGHAVEVAHIVRSYSKAGQDGP